MRACAIAPGVGANGGGDIAEAAVADLREALESPDCGVRRSRPAHGHGRRGLMPPVPSIRGERVFTAAC